MMKQSGEIENKKTNDVGVKARPSGDGIGNKTEQRPRSRSRRSEARVKPEFDQKIVSIRRVARVVAGGRRFSFSVALVAGNRKGSVGVGLGKASDTPVAIEKAFRDAQKNSIHIPLTKNSSIPFDVRGKVGASDIIMMPAPGRGVLAGSSVRDVVELCGIKNINVKIFSRSKNKLNNAKAAVVALSKIPGASKKKPIKKKNENPSN